MRRIGKILRPIVVSAFSFVACFFLLQPLAVALHPSFSLYANRGAGKIALTVCVLAHVILFLMLTPTSFRQRWYQKNISFFAQRAWIKNFLRMFSIFFMMHVGVLALCLGYNAAHYNPAWLNAVTWSRCGNAVFGFVATFFLAWTEELIFRGTLYLFFVDYLRPFSSALITSLIFALAHDLTNPFNLITQHWQLGLGLFLLGMLLNLIFIIAGNLYAGMGAHAGLVYVKVLLRRFPLIIFAPAGQNPYWINKDLRQSLFIHALFIVIISFLVIRYRHVLFTNQKDA